MCCTKYNSMYGTCVKQDVSQLIYSQQFINLFSLLEF